MRRTEQRHRTYPRLCHSTTCRTVLRTLPCLFVYVWRRWRWRHSVCLPCCQPRGAFRAVSSLLHRPVIRSGRSQLRRAMDCRSCQTRKAEIVSDLSLARHAVSSDRRFEKRRPILAFFRPMQSVCCKSYFDGIVQRFAFLRTNVYELSCFRLKVWLFLKCLGSKLLLSHSDVFATGRQPTTRCEIVTNAEMHCHVSDLTVD